MRVWRVSAVLTSDRLSYDWPVREECDPHAVGFPPSAFEDLCAPDAFGVQLLGPGYADRIPRSPRWRSERVGRATLVEHVDPAPWFGAPFVPFRQEVSPDQRPLPAVLEQARAELAPLLHSEGALARLGYP